MSVLPDWSKAPEGTTHCLPMGAVTAWYKEEESRVVQWHGGEWTYVAQNLKWFEWAAKIVARPDGWDGEGLPPVNTFCQYLHYAEQVWLNCEVVAHRNNAAVVIGDDYACDLVERSRLRLLKAPEQIASEERIAAAQAWLKGIERDYGVECADQCESILMEAEARRTAPTPQPIDHHRAKVVADMVKITDGLGFALAAEALYENGYRKVAE